MCDKVIHGELVEVEMIVCPFCKEEIQGYVTKAESCCKNREIVIDSGMEVCKNCGIVSGYCFGEEFLDFYRNRKRFYTKRVNTIVSIM